MRPPTGRVTQGSAAAHGDVGGKRCENSPNALRAGGRLVFGGQRPCAERGLCAPPANKKEELQKRKADDATHEGQHRHHACVPACLRAWAPDRLRAFASDKPYRYRTFLRPRRCPPALISQIYETFEDPSYSILARWYSISLMLLIVLATACFVLESEATNPTGTLHTTNAIVRLPARRERPALCKCMCARCSLLPALSSCRRYST